MSVLDVEMQSRGVSLRSRRAIVTLGGEDGTIDRVVINSRDGLALHERLAFAFRSDLRRCSIPYGSRAWLCRNSIMRAEAKVQNDVERVYDQTRRIVPDVVVFMNAELGALLCSLKRGKFAAARSRRVVRRMRIAMLVLIEAMRSDT